MAIPCRAKAAHRPCGSPDDSVGCEGPARLRSPRDRVRWSRAADALELQVIAAIARRLWPAAPRQVGGLPFVGRRMVGKTDAHCCVDNILDTAPGWRNPSVPVAGIYLQWPASPAALAVRTSEVNGSAPSRRRPRPRPQGAVLPRPRPFPFAMAAVCIIDRPGQDWEGAMRCPRCAALC